MAAAAFCCCCCFFLCFFLLLFLLLLFFFAFFLVFVVVVLVSFIDIRCRVDIRKISLMSFIPKDFEEKEAAAPLAWWQGLCVFVLLCPVWLLPFFAL